MTMTDRPLEALRLPPRGLPREVSASYIGVSPRKFDALVADGRMPRPVRIDGRVLWDRIALDRAFGRLAGQDEDDGDAWKDGA
jgi:predicted DNA-binding transcriptional regulator AlpA